MPWIKREVKLIAAFALLCCAIPVLKAHEQSWYQVLPTPAASPRASASPTPAATGSERFVLLDPSHGGDDRGAILSNHVLEKDVALAFARELHKALLERGIPCRLLREADISMSLERRAEAANDPHVILYIALHAGRLARSVRIYTQLAPSADTANSSFLLWGNAQHASLRRSTSIAQELAKDLGKENLAALVLAAPVRPLNNIVPPALAVEISPEVAGGPAFAKAGSGSSAASALAAAIADSRDQWSVRQ